MYKIFYVFFVCLLHVYICVCMPAWKCFYYISIFFTYLYKNLFVDEKKNPTWFGRCNTFIRVQLLAIIFQVSVFLLWELYSFHDTNRTSSKDQNPTCKHTGQKMVLGWEMSYITVYLDLSLLEFYKIVVMIINSLL